MMGHIRNQKGFSLVSAVMASAMLGVVGMGVASLSQYMAQVSKSSELRAQMQKEVFILQSAMSDPANCEANLKGVELEGRIKSLRGVSRVPRLVRAPGSAVLSTNTILPSQDPSVVSRLDVKDITVSLHPGSDRLVMLGVEYEMKDRNDIKLVGGDLRRRVIPLHVELSNNAGTPKIARCSSTPLPPEDPDVADSVEKAKQGNSCAMPPPDSTNQNGVPNRGAPLNVDRADADNAIDFICNQQNYPVVNGLRIARADINDCIDNRGQARNPRCQAILDIAFGESMQGIFRQVTEPMILKNRNGYANRAECKKQKNYSEGDVVTRFGNEGGTDRTTQIISIPDIRCGAIRGEATITTTVKEPSQKKYMCAGGHWVFVESQVAKVDTDVTERAYSRPSCR